jgi:hypothetical protein
MRQLTGSSAAVLLFTIWWLVQLQQLPTAAALSECSEATVQGITRFPIGSCTWPKQPPVPKQNSIHLLGAASGTFPGVLLSAPSNSTPTLDGPTAGDHHGFVLSTVQMHGSRCGPAVSTGVRNTLYSTCCVNTMRRPTLQVSAGALCNCYWCHAGMNLTIKRMMLLNVTVAPPANSSTGPKLLPQGLFAVPVSYLSLQDVRFSVPVPIFQQYLSFFQKDLFTVKSKQDGGVGMHTVSICSAAGPNQ